MLKKLLKRPILPKQCDLCHDPIGLYQPWYSIYIDPHFTKVNPKNEVSVLCPDCFRAYEVFLTQRELHCIHKREIMDAMGSY